MNEYEFLLPFLLILCLYKCSVPFQKKERERSVCVQKKACSSVCCLLFVPKKFGRTMRASSIVFLLLTSRPCRLYIVTIIIVAATTSHDDSSLLLFVMRRAAGAPLADGPPIAWSLS
jgi:hypothetical protein